MQNKREIDDFLIQRPYNLVMFRTMDIQHIGHTHTIKHLFIFDDWDIYVIHF